MRSSLPVHPEVQQAKPQLGRVDLDYSEEDPADSHEDEYEKPPPENKEHFVVDDVEREDAEGVDVGLFARRPEPVVGAGRDPRECRAHRVLGKPTLLLRRKAENINSITQVGGTYNILSGISIFLENFYFMFLKSFVRLILTVAGAERETSLLRGNQFTNY